MSAISFSAPCLSYRDLLAQVAGMPAEERQAVHCDLYGQDQPRVVENQELIESSLERLTEALERIPDKETYEMAQTVCPDYVNSTKFRLLFLRAELFDAELAATRLVTYWDTKVELFGVDRTFHKLTPADLDAEDRDAFVKGGVRLSPEKDDSNRSILLSYRAKWDLRRTHRQSMERLLWYMTHLAVEDDEDTQKNGLVLLVANGIASDEQVSHDVKLDRKIHRYFRTALPVRVVGFHHITQNKLLLRSIVEAGLFAMSRSMRARYRQYNGSQRETMEDLETFGIHSDMLPQEFGGTLDFDYDEWLRTLQHLPWRL